MNILVGSLNPVKVESVRYTFRQYFPACIVEGRDVPSLVSKQPVQEEVFTGAENRCKGLKKTSDSDGIKADFFVGIESGLIKLHHIWFNVDSVCVMDCNGRTGFGLSPAFSLEEGMTNRLLQGEELGVVIDEMYRTENIKQNGGAICVISQGKTTRFEHCCQAVLMALVRFL